MFSVNVDPETLLKDIFCASLKGTNQDAMVAWSVLGWRTKQCFLCIDLRKSPNP